MTGTVLNIITVLAGGLIGTLLGSRMPAKIHETVMNGLGLMVLVIGVIMASGTSNVLIPLISIVVGGILGELMRIDDGLNWLGARAEARWGGVLGQGRMAGWSVTRAFVSSSLIFCVGPMTILGSIQDGLLGDYELLAVKSALDGFVAIPFAASLGPGVLLSGGTVALVQGGLSALAMGIGGGLGDVSRETPWVIELTATGGVIMLGIGLSLLELKKIRIANLLPSIAIAPLLVWLLGVSGIGL